MPVANLNWTYWALNGEDSFGLLNSTYNGVANSTRQESYLCFIQTGPVAVPKGSGSCGSTGPLPAPQERSQSTPGSFLRVVGCWNVEAMYTHHWVRSVRHSACSLAGSPPVKSSKGNVRGSPATLPHQEVTEDVLFRDAYS